MCEQFNGARIFTEHEEVVVDPLPFLLYQLVWNRRR